jgi:VanZ like protein/concanavalin A-like lectin/glucanase superfamily protein
VGWIESNLRGMGSSVLTLLLKTICAAVLSGILLAGLWPFHSPQNDVSWLNRGNGLLLGKYGSIVSAGTFETNRSQTDSSCSIEVWLEPDRVNASGTILAFYWTASRIAPFSLRQSLGDLVLQRNSLGPPTKKARIYVNDVFSRVRPVFVTISSGATGTTVYLNGILVKGAPTFRFSGQDLTGQLVVGNAPHTSHNWSGQIKGLAVYDRELAAGEVSQHFADWTTSKQAQQSAIEGLVASYLFDEGKGSVVHNHVDPATNLLIPERFFVLRQEFLERPWDEFRSDWNYWKDVGINIGGFIPFGFFFRAYFSAIRKVKWATWLTITLGFSVSLTIEVLQAFLPTRDSGTTDLITNTFGTALGAVLCAWSMKHNWFARTEIAIL